MHSIHWKNFSRQIKVLTGKNWTLSIVFFKCWWKRTFETLHLVSINISLPSKCIFHRTLWNKIGQRIYPSTFEAIVPRSTSIWIYNRVMWTTKWPSTNLFSVSSFILESLLYNDLSSSSTSTYSWMVLCVYHRMFGSWMLCSCNSTSMALGHRKGDSMWYYSSTVYHSTP